VLCLPREDLASNRPRVCSRGGRVGGLHHLGVPASRRLAAILAADVAGYSPLVGADEEGTLNRLRSIRADVIDPKITFRARVSGYRSLPVPKADHRRHGRLGRVGKTGTGPRVPLLIASIN
jgi:hypothetical protein